MASCQQWLAPSNLAETVARAANQIAQQGYENGMGHYNTEAPSPDTAAMRGMARPEGSAERPACAHARERRSVVTHGWVPGARHR
jgi:hypothetical protein